MHRGALVLKTADIRQFLRPNAALGAVTALVTGTIFLVRGHGYRRLIWGDDELLVEHAIHRQTPFGRLHFIDPFGILDPFAGYLIVILRLTTKFLLLWDTETFPLRAYWLSSFIWTLIAVCIALLISGLTRPYLGFLAAMAMTIMPYSNLVMLAQVNTIYMPAVLAMIIAVVTRRYPQSKGFQIVVCVAFALVTLTSITTIVVFGYLISLVFFRRHDVQLIERRLIWVMGLALVLQLISYQPRGRMISPSSFLHEFLLSSNAFAPQFVREKILEPKSAIENIILYGIPILLGITVFVLVRLGNRSECRSQINIAQHFFLIAILLLCMLIIGNGWLNSHYLFIPTGLFWIGVILVSDATGNSTFRYRMLPITVVLAIFILHLSGTYFVI
ncbi:MAG: hypothetical protein AAB327_06495 [Actinomycetota bacterium]